MPIAGLNEAGIGRFLVVALKKAASFPGHDRQGISSSIEDFQKESVLPPRE
jgi:hypothetical protein